MTINDPARDYQLGLWYTHKLCGHEQLADGLSKVITDEFTTEEAETVWQSAPQWMREDWRALDDEKSGGPRHRPTKILTARPG